jgi:sulfur carrier protein ThiS
MKITVRSIGRLGAQVPPEPGGNRVSLDVPPDTTPADVLGRLGLSADRAYLVMVNGEVVPQERHARWALGDNDELTVLPKPKVG